MRILSLDASTKATGYAIFNDKKLENYGVISASSTDVIKRINKIVSELEQILTKEKVDVVILEEVRPDLGKIVKTYKALMYLQAAIAFLIHEKFSKIKIEYMYPSSWRKICGIKQGAGIKREALKIKDIEFVNKLYSLNITSDDIADAIGIGYGYLNKEKEEKSAF